MDSKDFTSTGGANMLSESSSESGPNIESKLGVRLFPLASGFGSVLLGESDRDAAFFFCSVSFFLQDPNN